MNDQMKKRCDELFAMGLRFNGKSYVGTEEHNNDFNFHYTEIQCDNDEQWNEKIEKVKTELKRRNGSL